MSDLKNYLWNNQTPTSVKRKYKNKILGLTEWPDFGFVGCPNDYIILSAYLVKQPLNYSQLQKLSDCKEEVLNHFLYVCNMLKILSVTEAEKSTVSGGIMNLLSTQISFKLKQLFY